MTENPYLKTKLKAWWYAEYAMVWNEGYNQAIEDVFDYIRINKYSIDTWEERQKAIVEKLQALRKQVTG